MIGAWSLISMVFQRFACSEDVDLIVSQIRIKASHFVALFPFAYENGQSAFSRAKALMSFVCHHMRALWMIFQRKLRGAGKVVQDDLQAIRNDSGILNRVVGSAPPQIYRK